MVYILEAAVCFPRRMLFKSPVKMSAIRSTLLKVILLLSLVNMSACQWFSNKCKYCGASLSGGKVHTAEGFDVCHECDRTAVRDIKAARATVAQVREELLSLGIKLPWGAVTVKLLPTWQKGVHARCEAARYANGGVADLWIKFIAGMPKNMFKAVAAHELTHAWAYLNRSPMKQDEELSEGGPTLVEYTYLEKHPSAYGGYRRDVIMTSSNKIYGKSTRRLQTYAKDHGGLAGVLTLLKTGEKIPDGY